VEDAEEPDPRDLLVLLPDPPVHARRLPRHEEEGLTAAQTVTVVVPARDAAPTIGAALAGLGAQRRAADEVIVVDDGSADATAAIAEASPVVTRVVRTDGAGPGAARNAGAAVATGDVLAFTDADCVPQPGWLEAALGALQDADLVQGRTTPPPGEAVGPFDRSLWVLAPWGLFETANLVVRRALFARLGGFEPWLSPAGGKELAEDVWFGWRAVRAGARTAFCDDAVVHHAVFPRSARAYVAERLRLRYFPVMAARIPELRTTFFHRRLFLTPRSAAFDAAVAGFAVAALARRPWPLLVAVPYARIARRRGRALPVDVAADAVGLAALLAGSVRARSPVL
jgi:glycosyltransferase involved in cell wall biosynthesis